MGGGGRTTRTRIHKFLETRILYLPNNMASFVFLSSTRCGGLGLNLQKASVVILFDADWNPQIDKQAIDRVHRIGQTKDVIVIRLHVQSDWTEELLEDYASQKLALEEKMLDGADFADPRAAKGKGGETASSVDAAVADSTAQEDGAVHLGEAESVVGEMIGGVVSEVNASALASASGRGSLKDGAVGTTLDGKSVGVSSMGGDVAEEEKSSAAPRGRGVTPKAAAKGKPKAAAKGKPKAAAKGKPKAAAKGKPKAAAKGKPKAAAKAKAKVASSKSKSNKTDKSVNKSLEKGRWKRPAPDEDEQNASQHHLVDEELPDDGAKNGVQKKGRAKVRRKKAFKMDPELVNLLREELEPTALEADHFFEQDKQVFATVMERANVRFGGAAASSKGAKKSSVPKTKAVAKAGAAASSSKRTDGAAASSAGASDGVIVVQSGDDEIGTKVTTLANTNKQLAKSDTQKKDFDSFDETLLSSATLAVHDSRKLPADAFITGNGVEKLPRSVIPKSKKGKKEIVPEERLEEEEEQCEYSLDDMGLGDDEDGDSSKAVGASGAVAKASASGKKGAGAGAAKASSAKSRKAVAAKAKAGTSARASAKAKANKRRKIADLDDGFGDDGLPTGFGELQPPEDPFEEPVALDTPDVLSLLTARKRLFSEEECADLLRQRDCFVPVLARPKQDGRGRKEKETKLAAELEGVAKEQTDVDNFFSVAKDLEEHLDGWGLIVEKPA